MTPRAAVPRTTIDQYERNTVLTVRKCERPDSGKYRLVLSNSSGTCEGICDVIVLGKKTAQWVKEFTGIPMCDQSFKWGNVVFDIVCLIIT